MLRPVTCKMTETLDKPTIFRLLSDLARKDRRRTVSGSAANDYKLNPPVPHVEAWNLPESFFEQEPDVPTDTPREEEDRLWEEW